MLQHAPRTTRSRSRRYMRPTVSKQIRLNELLRYCGRSDEADQKNLFKEQADADLDIFYAGDLSLLTRKCVSVIGARHVSEAGAGRARKIARVLADNGVVVTSGLAKGVDIEAHRAAIDLGGDTIAVIGTPLDKCYPIEHAATQEEIWTQHLLISQFRSGVRTFPSDFPKRNRLMAALTDASVIVEASDSSGTLHQAAECVRLGRWLFIMQSVVDDPDLEWPAKFLKADKVAVLRNASDVLDVIS